MAKAQQRPDFELAGHRIAAGTSATIDIPVSRLSTNTEISMRVRVLHGRKPGPVIFVSGSVHGDEIIGVEIVRRLLKSVSVKRLAGTLLCIPIVNSYGFIAHQRYLPDRRDLNRCFPGSPRGSLASQLAHTFTQEIIARSDFGVDLHSAALHRTNLPQIRISEGRPRAELLAQLFGAPAVIVSPLRDGSLRQTAAAYDCEVLLLEAGEALRFDELGIRIGVKGILRVMADLQMGVPYQKETAARSIQSRRTLWLRAPEGGIFRAAKRTGAFAVSEEIVGQISDPFGDEDIAVRTPIPGIIIGMSNLPVVNQGDALIHIAEVEVPGTALHRLNAIEDAAFADPLFDEDEIV
ncbi:succinylglutamate desuccinylase [Altererythrobacter confluentis]|uniref:Succinylglutamate desuccinylase n=1 Tax=Allopontixanthobacter confluentis TaxID=1849021 RepID=A0A6L7GFI8_9SPHN|nr:succinylglutamate desuccinylase/aspartoacylase family protein [Allopontixanthobacter confluentis]MXP14689.1 succinylglutamate desuccinylase [Allopontixanthobacter confluentis]